MPHLSSLSSPADVARVTADFATARLDDRLFAVHALAMLVVGIAAAGFGG